MTNQMDYMKYGMKQWINNKQNYKDGKLNGLYEKWYENGQLYIKCGYKMGKLDGTYMHWNHQGELLYQQIFEDGIKIN